MEEKYSVEEYLNDNSVLELQYIPYETKEEIVYAILGSLINDKASPRTIDSARLDRVSTEIFIEALTNLDLHQICGDGLNGYDELCRYNKLHELIGIIQPEYARLNDILNYKLEDFYRYELSNRMALKHFFNDIVSYIRNAISSVDKAVRDINVEEVTEYIKTFINSNTTSNGGNRNEGQ